MMDKKATISRRDFVENVMHVVDPLGLFLKVVGLLIVAVILFFGFRYFATCELEHLFQVKNEKALAEYEGIPENIASLREQFDKNHFAETFLYRNILPVGVSLLLVAFAAYLIEAEVNVRRILARVDDPAVSPDLDLLIDIRSNGKDRKDNLSKESDLIRSLDSTFRCRYEKSEGLAGLSSLINGLCLLCLVVSRLSEGVSLFTGGMLFYLLCTLTPSIYLYFIGYRRTWINLAMSR